MSHVAAAPLTASVLVLNRFNTNTLAVNGAAATCDIQFLLLQNEPCGRFCTKQEITLPCFLTQILLIIVTRLPELS